jgi:SNF2 family DNA or RNA helicase
MLNPEIINNFLNRKLDSWEWLKDIKRDKLEEEVSLDFKTTPYTHQLASMVAGKYNDNFLYLLEMGAGKTKIILDLLTYRKNEWKKGLILSPNVSTVYTWADECEKHSNLSYTILMGTKTERESLLGTTDTDLYFLNYTGLLLLLTNGKDGKWVKDDKKIKKFCNMFDVIVWDEIHKMKNSQSLSFKICKSLAKSIPLKYGLTGTPLNRDPMDLWSIFYLIDGGETLGETKGMFAEALFSKKINHWGGADFKFKKKYTKLLNSWISNKSLRYKEDEILDLPKKIFVKQKVLLSDEAIDDYFSTVKEFNSSKNIEVKQNSFEKLRQVCSGFITFKNEEDEKSAIVFKNIPKLEALVELIVGTPEDSKVVVFLDHIIAGDIVCDRLKKEKIGFERLYGGTKDKIGAERNFKTNPNCKVLVANTKSAGIGLNLQYANYVIFYELPMSSIDYKQALKRVHRSGQTKRVYIYSLITKDSVEEKIEKYLREGKTVFKNLIDAKL